MTEQKPLGVSWETWIDQLIRQAEAEGAFADNPFNGKPLPDLDRPYDPDWWIKQLVRREQITAVPPALEVLRKVEAGLAAIWKLSSESAVRNRITALNVEIARVNSRVAEGPPTTLAPLDADAIVAEWRRRSASKEKIG